MDQFINVKDFINHLTEHGMVITKRDALLSDGELQVYQLKQLQARLLSKKWLSYNEILKSKLLHYTSLSGLKSGLINRGLQNHEVQVIDGVNKVLTSALKRIINE